jgi:hypothetical protein
MFIATKTVTIHLPNGKQLKLVKDTNVSNGTYNKLSKTQRANYTAPKPSQLARRIPNRRAVLDQLGYFTDVNLLVMEQMVANIPDQTIRGWRTGMLKKMQQVEKVIIKHFALEDKKVSVNGITDDTLESTEAKSWAAWPLTAYQAPKARELAQQAINELF